MKWSTGFVNASGIFFVATILSAILKMPMAMMHFSELGVISLAASIILQKLEDLD